MSGCVRIQQQQQLQEWEIIRMVVGQKDNGVSTPHTVCRPFYTWNYYLYMVMVVGGSTA